MVVLGHVVKHTADTVADMTTVASQIGLNTNISKKKVILIEIKMLMNQKELK